MDYEIIKSYYVNARDQIKLSNPSVARQYVLKILNYGLDCLKRETLLANRIKIEAFLRKWIKVSDDLYNYGINDYVLECFGLLNVENTTTSKFQGWAANIFNENISSVVIILARDDSRESFGTGFIVSNDGYVLTNNHVLYDEREEKYFDELFMRFNDSDELYKIDIIQTNVENDIALCKFCTKINHKYSKIRIIDKYDSLSQGADILLIGNSFNMGLAPFTGIVRYTKDNSNNLVYTAPSNFGDSGAPVFNRFGECIGINKSKLSQVNDNYVDLFSNATPMDVILEFINECLSDNC